MLQKSDPFKKKLCERQNCPVCSSGGSGRCDVQDVTYKIECLGCDHQLNGETSNTAYTRILKHFSDLNSTNEDTFSSPRTHCVEQHENIRQKFRSSVTKTFKDDALGRQITEALKITAIPAGKSMNTRFKWNATKIPRITIG